MASGKGPERVAVYCLTALTEDDRQAYMQAFAEKNEEGGAPLVEPYLVEWSPAANNDRTEGDLGDMYRIWRSRVETPGAEHVDGLNFAFFIDRQSVRDVGVLVAEPDISALCHSAEGVRSALDMLPPEQRQALEASSARSLARDQEQDKTRRRTLEQVVAMWVGDTLADLYDEYPESCGQRILPYGRMPATGLPSTWANLFIANMSMSELVEYLGRKGEVEGEGVVCHYVNPGWDDPVFLQRFSEMMDKSIAAENERLAS